MEDAEAQDLSIDTSYFDNVPLPAAGTLASELRGVAASELISRVVELEANSARDVDQIEALVYAHYYIFSKMEIEAHLDEAVRKLEHVVEDEIDPGHPKYDTLLRLLVCLLFKKVEYSHALSDLEPAIFRAKSLLNVTDHLHPDRYARWMGISRLLGILAAIAHDQSQLDEWIENAQRATEEAAICLDSTDPAMYTPGDKTALMTKLKKVLAVTPPGHYARDFWMDKLATLAFLHWKQFDRDPGLLDHAIDLNEKAISAARDDTGRGIRLFSIGSCLLVRYEEYSHEPADLDSAIERIGEAIATSPEYNGKYLKSSHNALQLRFQHRHTIADLERATQILQQLLDKMQPGDPERPLQQDHLANDFIDLFKNKKARTEKDWELLDKALRLNKEVYAFVNSSPIHSEAPRLLNNYASHLVLRFEQKGTLEDLHFSHKLYERAVSPPYDKHPDRPRYLSALAIHLINMFQRLGEKHYLDEAIRRGEETLAQTSGDFTEKSRVFDAIQNALVNQFDATGDESLLREAIRQGEKAVDESPVLDPEKMLRLNNLTGLYLRLYERSSEFKYIEKGVATQKQALKIAPLNHDSRPLLSFRLAQCLFLRYEYDTVRFAGDIDTAINNTRSAVHATPEDHQERPRREHFLAQLLHAKWKQPGQPLSVLEDAINYAKTSCRVSPEESPETTSFVHELASCLADLFSHSGNPLDLIQAAQIAQSAMGNEWSPANYRIRCAILAINAWYQLGQLEAVADLAEKAVGMLHLLSSRALQQTDQQFMLKQFGGLTTMAVASSFEAGRSHSHCLKLLENGRNIINGLRYDSRIDLTQLRSKRRDLADEFMSIQSELDKVVVPPASQGDNILLGPGVRTNFNRRHELTRRYNKVLCQIRKEVDNFDTFLAPLEEKELANISVSTQEAVVVINVGFRCDAILVQNGHIDHVQLEKLTEEDVNRSVADMRSIRRGSNNTAVQDRYKLTRILVWLWNSVVKQVLDKLGFTSPPATDGAWPRVWWVPTGALSQLPLHAAGYHTPGGHSSALDRVLSSYSSSIKALHYTRRNQKPRDPKEPGNSILLSYVRHAEDVKPLPGAKDEVDELVALLRPAYSDNSIDPIIPLAEPRQADLLERLPSCAIFHFAGHGTSHPVDPSASCLLTRGWKTDALTVRDLIGLNLYSQSPWLAYLSACSTGESVDEDLADEAIHLMSACHAAGFQHVVGSLWEIMDQCSVDVAKDVYGTLVKEGGLGTTASVARAVHEAVRRLRRLTFGEGKKEGRRVEGDERRDDERGDDERGEEGGVGEESQGVGKDRAEVGMENELGIEKKVEDTKQEGAEGREGGDEKVGAQEEAKDRGLRTTEVIAISRKSDPLIWAAYIHVGL